MVQIISYFLLFGLMFFILPLGHSPFEVPKVFAAVAFIVVLTVFMLSRLFLKTSQGDALPYGKASPYKLPRTESPGFSLQAFKRFAAYLRGSLKPFFTFILPLKAGGFRRSGYKTAFFVLLVSLALYHLFFPIYPEHLLLGNAWRPHGTILYLSLFLLFLVAKSLPFNISILSKLSFYSLIILTVFTLLIGPRGSFRFIGPLGEPTALAAAVLFLYPLTTKLSNKKQRYISLILSLVLILLTGSRIPIVGFLMEICLLNIQKHKKIFTAGISALAILLIFSAFAPFLPRNLPQEYFLRFGDRAQIWQTSFIAAQQAPLLGNGFGSVQDVIYKVAWDTSSFLRFQSVDNAHNLFLQWWIMVGLIGALILLSLIVLSIRNFYKSRSFVLLSILVGLLVVQLFNPVSVVTLVHFFWLLGIGVSKDRVILS